MGEYFPEPTPELLEIILKHVVSEIKMEDLSLLQMGIRQWADDTFLSVNPVAQVHKLKEEVDELMAAEPGTPEFASELADCFIMLLDISLRVGMGVRRLAWEAMDKHHKNKAATWGVKRTEGDVTIYGRQP